MKNLFRLSSVSSVRFVLSQRNPDTSGLKRPPPKTLNADHPEPIRGNPKLRAETCASGLTGVENPNRNTALNGQCNTPQIVAPVALCCSVLHRVARKIFQPSGATPPRFVV